MGIGRSCDRGTRLVIIVIAARVKPRVENEPNVTCGRRSTRITHLLVCTNARMRSQCEKME